MGLEVVRAPDGQPDIEHDNFKLGANEARARPEKSRLDSPLVETRHYMSGSIIEQCILGTNAGKQLS